jgi:hypothetical protein
MGDRWSTLRERWGWGEVVYHLITTLAPGQSETMRDE